MPSFHFQSPPTLDPAIQQAILAAVNSAVSFAITNAFAELQIKFDANFQSLRSMIRNSSASKHPTSFADKQLIPIPSAGK